MDDWVLACRNVEVARVRYKKNKKTWRECVKDDMEVFCL